jgi:hypothetical protein
VSKSIILDLLAIGGEVSASKELEENQHALQPNWGRCSGT